MSSNENRILSSKDSANDEAVLMNDDGSKVDKHEHICKTLYLIHLHYAIKKTILHMDSDRELCSRSNDLNV